MLDYEQGHLHLVSELFKQFERRDPFGVLPQSLPEPLPFESQREFVRNVLVDEVGMRANGTEYVPLGEESAASIDYRTQLNAEGSPTDMVAEGYNWLPGTELRREFVAATRVQ
jgi:hypothetical protein